MKNKSLLIILMTTIMYYGVCYLVGYIVKDYFNHVVDKKKNSIKVYSNEKK